MPKQSLQKYREKRDFEVTSEPDQSSEPSGGGPLRYCLQKHAARRLHYDLRLEVDGVLVSWAVPKGPSFDTQEKRVAIHVEDHPLGYATFEGTIPKGEYGGGEVIVWDEGVYSPDEEGTLHWNDREEAQRQMREGLAKGKLSVTFVGKKLKGSWTLVKIAKSDKDWLLIKHKDFAADPANDNKLDDRSVISGRTLEDVREGKSGKTLFDKVAATAGAKLAPMPRTLAPMLLSETKKAFDRKGWLFEIKLDGIRVLAFVQSGKARLLTRNGKDATRKFPSMALELGNLPDCILDGEIVTYDSQGRPTFQGLMERFQLDRDSDIARIDRAIPAEFCVFDMIHFGEWDLRKSALEDRRARLADLNPRSPSVRVMDAFPEEGELLFETATQMGFEGIVAKNASSTYKDGQRTSEWLKIKSYETEEFLVVGYLPGEGSRASTFGSLILASRSEEGHLEFCGMVGGGFGDQQLKEVKQLLDEMPKSKSPFKEKIDMQGQKPTWIEPKLWVEVRYANRTRENRLRFPTFLHMRPDLSDMPDAGPAIKAEAKAQAEPSKVEQKEVDVSDPVQEILEQLQNPKDDFQMVIAGDEVKLTSLSRVLWPETSHTPAFTKRDLIAYYAQMSEHLIRHAQNRPISFVRLPAGLGGERFFQKHWEKGLPEWIDTVPIYSSSNDKTKPYLLINKVSTLVWLAQMASLEIHPWYSRVTPDGGAEDRPTDTGSSDAALDESTLNYPDFMVIDLDPMIRSGQEEDEHEPELNKDGWQMTVDVAAGVKELLDGIGLKAFPKTSGKAGLHIYVPLERLYEYEVVRMVCETLGRHVERSMPDKVTMEWQVKKRPNKIFFDHNQNVRGKTLSGAYTVRAVGGAPVSMPFRWEQLHTIYPTDFNMQTAPAFMASHRDAWEEILKHRQRLPGT